MSGLIGTEASLDTLISCDIVRSPERISPFSNNTLIFDEMNLRIENYPYFIISFAFHFRYLPLVFRVYPVYFFPDGFRTAQPILS
jgi:hypothetical protein